MITATAASTDPAEGGSDQSLPDPSAKARTYLAATLLLAILVAVVLNALHLTTKVFVPPPGDVNFVLLAAFYAAAQIIERIMELVVPLLPAFPPESTGNVRAAYVKADRAKLALGAATMLAVLPERLGHPMPPTRWTRSRRDC